MASESVPLLEAQEGSAGRFLSRFGGLLRNMSKIVDGVFLVLAPVGFACSGYLLASTSSTSTCKKMNAPDLIVAALQVLPILLAGGILCTSPWMRGRMGSRQAPAVSIVQVLCGITMMEWISICVLGASATAVLTAGSVLAAGVSWRARHSSSDSTMSA